MCQNFFIHQEGRGDVLISGPFLVGNKGACCIKRLFTDKLMPCRHQNIIFTYPTVNPCNLSFTLFANKVEKDSLTCISFQDRSMLQPSKMRPHFCNFTLWLYLGTLEYVGLGNRKISFMVFTSVHSWSRLRLLTEDLLECENPKGDCRLRCHERDL